MGGGKVYPGGFPENVHRNMFIPNELFDIHRKVLRESLQECGISKELIECWLKIDDTFRHSIIKSDISQCEKPYKTDEFRTPKPPGF